MMSKYKIILWISVVFWMLVIFKLSSQPAPQSNQLSKKVTKVVVRVAERAAPRASFDINLNNLNAIIRKNAHFFAYMVLGVLVVSLLRAGGLSKVWGVVYALSICTLYAALDETHQLFVPGRGGQITDVFIDSAGAAFGIALYLLAESVVRKVEKRRHKR